LNLSQAFRFLDSFLNHERTSRWRYGKDLNLDGIRRLLDRLGRPDRRFRILHIAGTKGKGSTGAFAAAILQAAGSSVGLYTSPHLVDFRERIRINGRPIAAPAFCRVVARVLPAADRRMTFFDVTTACALVAFEQARVESAVLETGLGGRIDSTNAVTPAVTGITPVSLDHTDQLGRTVARIAAEKGGILKPGVPAVIALQEPAGMRVIARIARRVGAPLRRLDREVRIGPIRVTRRGTAFRLRTPERDYGVVRLPLLGRHQAVNAAAAVRMAELWWASRIGDFPGADRLKRAVVRQGLRLAVQPARCQLLPGLGPLGQPVILDGAQNGASAWALRRTVEELFPGRPVCLIFGACADKEIGAMAEALGPWARRLVLTRAAVPRAADPKRLARHFRRWHPAAAVTGSVGEGIRAAFQGSSRRELFVAAGSLFVAAECLRRFRILPYAD